MPSPSVASAAALLVRALREAGVRYLFANFGSDHPAIIEALARDRERGVPSPVVVLCPHESTALSAAHGYAAVTGEPQAVFVHTDVGTANLGGAVHNAARSRVPVFVFAGLTPYTLEGEHPGTRNTHVNTLQDAPDQHALVRQYVKWTYDIRTAANVPQLVHRSLQLARSAPAGPVYLTGAREVLAQEAEDRGVDVAKWRPVEPVCAPSEVANEIADALSGARSPVIITTYLGRDRDAVPLLIDVAERFGAAVVEFNAEVLNFPHDHPLHAGDDPHRLLAEADVVLAIDVDVPWVHAIGMPREDASVYVANEDPLQESVPLWYGPADRYVRTNAARLLEQLRAAPAQVDAARVAGRRDRLEETGRELRDGWRAEAEADAEAGRLTPASVTRVLAGLVDDETIVLNETISAAQTVWKHLPRRLPGTLFGNRGTSLGWSGGGALGVKLATGEATVVSLVGDGTYFFCVPSSSSWVADRYGIPVLTVVYDNGGWNATKRNLVRQHPGGAAETTDRYWVDLEQSADFGGIAQAAGGAWARTVTEFRELEGALADGLAQVRGGTQAVVTVRLEAISAQGPEPVGLG